MRDRRVRHGFRCALENFTPQIEAWGENRRALIEVPPEARVAAIQRGSHAGVLRALAGEQERRSPLAAGGEGGRRPLGGELGQDLAGVPGVAADHGPDTMPPDEVPEPPPVRRAGSRG